MHSGRYRAHEAREECLEALYRLERGGRPITLETLRKSPDLAAIDISDTLLDLMEEGDIEVRGGTISLNRTGRLTGRRICRHHELAEGVLRFFGLRGERAHREACRLEHVMSLPGERRHGPQAHDELPRMFSLLEQGALPLARCRRGVLYHVAMVYGGHGSRRKLEDMGVSPGAQVELCSRQDRGPVEISVRGSRLALGHGIASKVLVMPSAGAGEAPPAVGFAAGLRGFAWGHGHRHDHGAHGHPHGGMHGHHPHGWRSA